MTDRLSQFLDFSTELTCFTRFELLGSGQAQEYLDTARRVVGTVLDDLLDAYKRSARRSIQTLATRHFAGRSLVTNGSDRWRAPSSSFGISAVGTNCRGAGPRPMALWLTTHRSWCRRPAMLRACFGLPSGRTHRVRRHRDMARGPANR